MLRRLLKDKRGFTLIELMIVVTLIGILAAIAAPNYQWGIVRAKEAVLKEDLYTLNSTIDQFLADQGKYPDALDELVQKKYLAAIPKDPFTNANDTWKTLPPPTTEGEEVKGNVYEVRSGSDKISPSDHRPYSEWSWP